MNLKKSMSNINSVKEKLSNTIETALCEVIKNKKCILLDVPYYNNIGDTLILQGTLDFLSKNNIKCIRQSSIETFDFPLIDSNITILLQGGGNFGDIWERHQIFRSKVISKYPSNQIVILPQTVYFNNHKKMIADAAILAKHSNLTICGRDDNSYQILIKYYSANSILLLPDMAFCIKNSTINKIKQNRVVGTLLLKRKDCELSENIDLYQYIGNNTFEEKDWPTLESNSLQTKLFWKLYNYRGIIGNKTVEYFFNHFFKNYLVNTGIRFVSGYSSIYTTRLHVAILSILLNKDFVFFDNSYGKNYSFYCTWLKDLNSIKFIN